MHLLSASDSFYLLQFYLQLKNMAKHSVLSQLCFLSAQDQHSYEYIYVAQKKSPCILVTKISVHTVTKKYQIGQCWKKYQNSNYQKEKRVLIFFIRFQTTVHKVTHCPLFDYVTIALPQKTSFYFKQLATLCC